MHISLLNICRAAPYTPNTHGLNHSKRRPTLPAKLPAKYKYASKAANLREAQALAPLTHVTHPNPSTGYRLLECMAISYAKTTDLHYIHMKLAKKHKKKLSTYQTGIIVGAALISIGLLVAPDAIRPGMKTAACILAALLALANTWVKFARHEQLEAEHTVSMQDFADIYFDIDKLFTTLGVLGEKGNLVQMLDWVAVLAEETPLPLLPSLPPSPTINDAPSATKASKNTGDSKEASQPLTRDELMNGLAPTPQFKVGEGGDDLSLEMKLQRWYRKAVEYNIANILAADSANSRGMQCNVALLTMMTLAAVFLAFDGPFPLIAAVLAASVTAFGGMVRFQDYNLKFQEHTAISIQWAGVERELLTILHACTEEQQMERFHDAAEHFDASLKRQPLLPPLRFFKNEKGKPLFELITERGGHEEKASNLLAMRALLKEPSGTDLLVGAPDTDTDYTIGCGLQTLAGWPVTSLPLERFHTQPRNPCEC